MHWQPRAVGNAGAGQVSLPTQKREGERRGVWSPPPGCCCLSSTSGKGNPAGGVKPVSRPAWSGRAFIWSVGQSLTRRLDLVEAGRRQDLTRNGFTWAQGAAQSKHATGAQGKFLWSQRTQRCNWSLEPLPTHPDSGPRDPTGGPTDPSSGPSSPPWACLGPEHLDSLCQPPANEGGGLRTPQDARTPDSEPLLGATASASTWALPEAGEQAGDHRQEEEECPICTEPYGPSEHCLTLLNCGHGLCVGCLRQLLGTAPGADLGRVRCPLCRQKTPMLEWEICRLQEELLQADGPQRPPPPTPPTPPGRRPGPWGSLEHRYQPRFLVGPVGSRGCLPFLPCPPCLGIRLWALRERGPCARRLVLLSLLALELLGLLLIFTPLMLLGLLFMLLDRASH